MNTKDQLARTLRLKKFWIATSVLLTCIILPAGILLEIPSLIALAVASIIVSLILAICYHKEAEALEISIQLEPIISWFFTPTETEDKDGSGEKVEDSKEK